MSGPITPHQVALACGAGGAYVDVTSYVEFGEGITYGYGRPDQFSDPVPGTFKVTLNNSDGRFTPGNPSSPLATTVTEGMGVAWLLGTRLVHTQVLAIEIPTDEATWNQIVLTCDDMLGTAGRFELTDIADQLTALQNPVLWWKLDEGSSATAGAETYGSPLGSFAASSSNPTTTTQLAAFGQPQNVALPGTAVTVTAGAGETTRFGTQHGNTQLRTNLAYPAVTDTTQNYHFGQWAFWVYPGSTINFYVVPFWAVGAGFSDSMQVIVTPTTVGVKGGTNTALTHTYSSAEATAPHYVSVYPTAVWQSNGSYWALQLTLELDGVSLGLTFMQSAVRGYAVPPAMLANGTAMQPLEVGFAVTGGTTAVSGTVQRLVHAMGSSVTLEQNALLNTEDQRRAVLDTLGTTITSAAYNGRPSLSTAPIGFPDVSNRSILDLYNDIIRTEQGHLFCTTTGSLTSPFEQIQVRDRDRPTTVKAAFHVTDEADGIPAFVRDITNVAASVEVDGPNGNVTVTDPTITGRYITSGLSETVLFANAADQTLWGQDRLQRGKNVGLRIATLTIDAFTTNRSADLLSLVPGDRIQVTGLPAAVLGFATWDGWVIGCDETHSMADGVGRHQFAYRLQPTLPSPGLLDTALLANSGDITLAASCTATDTTLTVTSASGDTFSTATPYDCTLGTGGEQIRVTGVAGNTLTVLRGVNGTTAIAHTTLAPIELVAAPILAF